MLLDGKVAYVSGASGSIGAAIVRRLCEQGARVVAGDVEPASAEALCAQLRGEGHDAPRRAPRRHLARRDRGRARRRARRPRARRHRLRERRHRLQRPGARARQRHLGARARRQHDGRAATLQVFGARMVEQRSGALVVTASISSLRGAHSMGAYCASKFAVLGLVESLAKEVGEYGVRVNCVNPGPVEGGLARAMIRETAETQGRSEQESYDELTAPIALGRLVEPGGGGRRGRLPRLAARRVRHRAAARRRRRDAREVARAPAPADAGHGMRAPRRDAVGRPEGTP